MGRYRRRGQSACSGLALALTALVSLTAHRAARADNDPAVQRGVQFLRGKVGQSQVGETALIALALLKAEVPPGDASVAACVQKLRSRFQSNGYSAERGGGQEIYEAAVVALALSNLDAEARRGELSALASFIVSRQNANGSWDYHGRPYGDTSISQYAVLGLWECENGGASVPPQAWDRAASFFMSVQNPTSGSWNYHRDEADRYPETLSMTAAGVGSLLICNRQLARFRRSGDALSSLLTPLTAESERESYQPSNSAVRIEQAARRGMAWLGSHFTTSSSGVIGPSTYYGLYGIERIGALADKETLGRVNWFEQGRAFINATQRGDGAWDSTHGDVCNTAWAILFITKSTAKTIRRVEIKRLGAGTLLGGRYLPKDLTNLTVAGGRVVARPMNGAVEGMLAVLEDPRGQNADSALAGLVQRYRSDGPKVLRPHKDRFRKLLTDRDPGLRKVAAWALARTADMDVVPLLIETLNDPDDSVTRTSVEGLRLLSRKIEGFGPPANPTPEQRQAAVKEWSAWYASEKPLDLEGQDAARPERKAP
ncbi:MAG: HEAT repeat domain-containing protein [Isosphaeraceae bacterium]